MLASDPFDRVLIIDLTKRRATVVHRPDLIEGALGGVGLATRLLQEECPDGADPLGPENPIILAVGPLSGLFPMASKTIAMFKSPHTGNLGESHAGGRSAIAIRMAGYCAIVIRGASSSPVYLVIEGDKVHFRDARAMWGMHSAFPAGSIIRERESGAGMRTIMRIGPAGEKGVSYASVVTETYRHFGRLGLGAVFGSKLLKGIVVSGVRSLPVSDPRLYRKTYDEIFKATTESSLFKKYHELGTAVNVLPLDALGALPTRNLQAGHYEGAAHISGERLAEEYLGRRVACAHCPVACIHLAAVRFPYPDQPYFYKTNMIPYDHEPIFAVGSMLGGKDGQHDTRGMFALLDMADSLGLDVMSMGCTLAWATEAFERGVIGPKETDGLMLAWGDYPTYVQAAERIISQPNDFYAALLARRGVRRSTIRRRGLCAGDGRQRDGGVSHRAGLLRRLPRRRSEQPPGQCGLCVGSEERPKRRADTRKGGPGVGRRRALAAGVEQPGDLYVCSQPLHARPGAAQLEGRGHRDVDWMIWRGWARRR